MLFEKRRTNVKQDLWWEVHQTRIIANGVILVAIIVRANAEGHGGSRTKDKARVYGGSADRSLGLRGMTF
jgi:hypothetical protein